MQAIKPRNTQTVGEQLTNSELFTFPLMQGKLCGLPTVTH